MERTVNPSLQIMIADSRRLHNVALFFADKSGGCYASHGVAGVH